MRSIAGVRIHMHACSLARRCHMFTVTAIGTVHAWGLYRFSAVPTAMPFVLYYRDFV